MLYPISILGAVFYCVDGSYFEVFEDGSRKDISREEFDSRTQVSDPSGKPHLLIDDKQVDLLLQAWKHSPELIDLNKLKFYMDFGIISDRDYNSYKQLILGC